MKTVEEVLATYPKEIVDFFENTTIEGWEINKNLSSYLPSPINQLMNKLSRKENSMEYVVTFTIKEKKDVLE